MDWESVNVIVLSLKQRESIKKIIGKNVDNWKLLEKWGKNTKGESHLGNTRKMLLKK